MISDSAPNQIYMYNASLPSLKLTVRRTLNKTLTDHNNYANGNCGQFNTFIVYEINARQRTIVVFNLPSTTIESQHNYFVIWRPVWTLLLLLLYRLSFDFFRLRSTKFRVFFFEFYILKIESDRKFTVFIMHVLLFSFRFAVRLFVAIY